MDSQIGHLTFCKVCSNQFNKNDNLPFAYIENGKYGGYYYAGNRVSIQANVPKKSLIFSHWEGNGVTFENKFSSKTSFLMPNNNVSIKAVYELLSESQNFIVSPNPFENIIKINFNAPLTKSAKLNLISMIGVVLKEWTTNQQENSFDILGFPSGFYILKCEINGKIEAVKLVKD